MRIQMVILVDVKFDRGHLRVPSRLPKIQVFGYRYDTEWWQDSTLM